MVYRFRNMRHPVFQLRDEMDRLLGGVLGPWSGFALPGADRQQPAVNMWQRADCLIVEAEVPGLKSDDVEIAVVGDQLTLKIERPEDERKDVVYHRRERPAGSFSRVLRLPTDVDPNRVEAELRDGVLTITLPKAESAKPRKIQVNAAP